MILICSLVAIRWCHFGTFFPYILMINYNKHIFSGSFGVKQSQMIKEACRANMRSPKQFLRITSSIQLLILFAVSLFTFFTLYDQQVHGIYFLPPCCVTSLTRPFISLHADKLWNPQSFLKYNCVAELNRYKHCRTAVRTWEYDRRMWSGLSNKDGVVFIFMAFLKSILPTAKRPRRTQWLSRTQTCRVEF